MQLYRRVKEIEEGGARLVLIGQATPRHAAHFRRRQEIELPILADEHSVTYEAIGTKRTVSGLMKPNVIASGFAKAIKNREVQGRPVGDVQRLGAAMIIAPGGEVVYKHHADDAADNPPIDDLITHTRA